MKLKFLVWLLLFFGNQQLKGQDKIHDFQTWTDVNLSYLANKELLMVLDGGLRGFTSKTNWNQQFLRAKIKFFINPIIQIAAGSGVFGANSDDTPKSIEYRIFEEFTLGWPAVAFGTFKNRFRFEQRFFNYPSDSITPQPHDFVHRGRYQLEFESSDVQFGSSSSLFYFMVASEWFHNFARLKEEPLIKSHRLVTGYGQRFNRAFKYELQYILQNSKDFSPNNQQTTDHIIRARLFFTLYSKKAQENSSDG